MSCVPLFTLHTLSNPVVRTDFELYQNIQIMSLSNCTVQFDLCVQWWKSCAKTDRHNVITKILFKRKTSITRKSSCKRHTTRRVRSARSAVLSQGVPHPDRLAGGGTLSWPGQGEWFTPFWPGPYWGTPHSARTGVPPRKTWDRTWDWGTPPPRCEQTATCENSTFPSFGCGR